MRRLFTTEDAAARGLTSSAMRWSVRTGQCRRIDRGIYADGPEDPDALDCARAIVLRTGGVACGRLAAVLHGLDGVVVGGAEVTVSSTGSGRRPGVRRRGLPSERIVVVGGVPCTDGMQTLLDLAPLLSDLVWEQALESALRKGLLSVEEAEQELPALARARPGVGRIRRVLRLRPPGAPPTGSLLETLMVQLARAVPGLAEPVRQLRVESAGGTFIAFVDLSWPDLGLFIELDGQQHKGQPVYDAMRETAVVATKGWLCGRFTWTEVVHLPVTTRRKLAALATAARGRPLMP
jgi:hypothetical protein